MGYDEYVDALRQLLSGDADLMRAGNEALFIACIDKEDRKRNPLLALADADKTK